MFKGIYTFLIPAKSLVRSYCTNVKECIKPKPILYGDEVSPPVRFVMMTARALQMDLDFHKIDLFKSEQKLEFYRKINPIQKIPALQVGKEVICDSHAISIYLCKTSENREAMYPQDPVMQALVDQILYYNATTLFPIDSSIYAQYFAGRWPIDESLKNDWIKSLDFLEHRLNSHLWLSSNEVRLCDLCCVATISSLKLLIPEALEKHEKVTQWMERISMHPIYQANIPGLERLKSFIKIVK